MRVLNKGSWLQYGLQQNGFWFSWKHNAIAIEAALDRVSLQYQELW
jgi:hypothetical protein